MARPRPAEVNIESEVSAIIEAAVAGDFSQRLDAAGMSGFFRKLSTGINDLLDANNRALGDVATMLQRLSASWTSPTRSTPTTAACWAS